MGQKKILGRGLSVLNAVAAPAVNLEPMTAQFEAVAGGGADEDVLDVAAGQVLRLAAMNAEQMVVVVVSPVAQLIVQIAVLQHHAAQHTGLNQYLQCAVDGGPAQPGRQLLA